MGDYRHNLSLRIEHDSTDLSSVPAELDLPVKRLWKAGDPRATPKGNPLAGVYRNSYCCLGLEASPDGLPKTLSDAVIKLEKHKSFLHQLAENGATMRFFVGWYTEGNSRDILDWNLLREIADLHISLDFDVYENSATPADES